MNNKRTLVNLYKDIVLVTRVRIFCTTLFTNNNIKVVIQIHTFLMDHITFEMTNHLVTVKNLSTFYYFQCERSFTVFYEIQ